MLNKEIMCRLSYILGKSLDTFRESKSKNIGHNDIEESFWTQVKWMISLSFVDLAQFKITMTPPWTTN